MKLKIWAFRMLKKGLSLSRNLALVSFLLARFFFQLLFEAFVQDID